MRGRSPPGGYGPERDRRPAPPPPSGYAPERDRRGPPPPPPPGGGKPHLVPPPPVGVGRALNGGKWQLPEWAGEPLRHAAPRRGRYSRAVLVAADAETGKTLSTQLLSDATTVLGRDRKARAVVVEAAHESVSRQHAAVLLDPSGETAFVADLRSQNGTKLSGAPMRPGELARLGPGDWFTLARCDAVRYRVAVDGGGGSLPAPPLPPPPPTTGRPRSRSRSRSRSGSPEGARERKRAREHKSKKSKKHKRHKSSKKERDSDASGAEPSPRVGPGNMSWAEISDRQESRPLP